MTTLPNSDVSDNRTAVSATVRWVGYTGGSSRESQSEYPSCNVGFEEDAIQAISALRCFYQFSDV